MTIVVTEQEFQEWKASRVTKAFMKAIHNDREWLKEMLLAGTEDDASIRGRAAACTAILALDYNELMSSVAEKRDV
jgi:hypothetical protein